MSSEHSIRRIDEILDNTRAVVGYVDGLDLASFKADRKTIDAVERCLERISEASRRLGQDVKATMPSQPWRQIEDLGNVLRHEYHKIRLSEIWEIATKDLPLLFTDVQRARGRLSEASDPA